MCSLRQPAPFSFSHAYPGDLQEEHLQSCLSLLPLLPSLPGLLVIIPTQHGPQLMSVGLIWLL